MPVLEISDVQIQIKIIFGIANLINTQSRLNFILHHTNCSPYINHIHRTKSKSKLFIVKRFYDIKLYVK